MAGRLGKVSVLERHSLSLQGIAALIARGDIGPINLVGVHAVIDLNGGGHPRHLDFDRRHVVNMNVHRDALRPAHPGEDRVDRSNPCPFHCVFARLIARTMLATDRARSWNNPST
jgi:hypothetical protein